MSPCKSVGGFTSGFYDQSAAVERPPLRLLQKALLVLGRHPERLDGEPPDESKVRAGALRKGCAHAGGLHVRPDQVLAAR
nr:MAG TPA: hypothetical protein [Bacteriophage sp.]